MFYLVMYPILKQIHIILVICSLTFFQFRFWFYRVKQNELSKSFKVAPHVIDTLLFTSGIGLALMTGFSPGNSPWLLYKLMALLFYIVFGVLAMKKSGIMQWLGYLMATTAVAYIIFTATQKSAWPF
ncbi:MAG: SirB2 family protein [Marinicella sp.]